jgi:twitching motility protein PilT
MALSIVELLKTLIQSKGSDLHIIAGLPPAIRVNGELTPLPNYDRLKPEETKQLLYSILNEYQKKKFETDRENRGELDFALGVPGLGRFRINVHLQRGTVAAAIRALASKIPNIDDLGLPPAVKRFAQAKHGMVLVTGPTGSGKSTTLAAMIDIINTTRYDHIITIEDPIEYLHNAKKSYVTQREVGPLGDSLSFPNALKFALRQDPDVILIGEMRDFVTIGIALTSAETGHLVLGTLHTSSASKTINRIIDVFPSEQQPQVRTQLAAHLVGVVSQVLFPRIDQPGRVVAAEVMFCNGAIRNNIRNGKVESIYQTLQTSKGDGMLTMDHSLINLVKEGKICYETARPYVQDDSTHQILQQLDRTSAISGGRRPDISRSQFRNRAFFSGSQGSKTS